MLDTYQYSGYNQIRMHPKDEDKTSFRGSLANLCYTVMPFGLKNVGATYQCLMDWILKEMIGRNVKAYVDDMVVKSLVVVGYVEDLKEFFQTLDR